MARETFIFYSSFLATIEKLPEDCQLQMFRAVCKYGLEQTEPQFSGSNAIFLEAIWCSIQPQLDANYQRFVNGQKGGCPKGISKPSMIGNQNARKQNQTETKPNQNQELTETKPNNNNNNNNNNKESIRESAPRFTPPSLSDVQEYCTEKHLQMSAQEFVDYYTANGWQVGRNKMKDWHAACRNWAAREQEFGRKPQTQAAADVQAFEQRERERARREQEYEHQRRNAASPEQASAALEQIMRNFRK